MPEITKTGDLIVIDLHGSCFSYGLYSRKIWQVLFREVQGEQFQCLDSFLCDLACFKDCFEKGQNSLFWRYGLSGYTDITDFKPFVENRDVFHVQYLPQQQRIEIERLEDTKDPIYL